MKKVQNASDNEKALDELFKRYEERGATYDGSSEYAEQKKREIKMRANTQRVYKATREYTSESKAEIDTAVVLQGIDRARYSKRESMNNSKNDVKSKLMAQADKINPKTDDKQGKSSNIKEVVKVAAKTWIPVNERKEEKIKEGGKTKVPKTLIFAIIVITISLLMIVASAVLLGSAKNEQNELENRISLLDAEITELRTDLDRKNADADIETFAKEELGMISQEHVNFIYIDSNKTDELEKQEIEKVSFGSLMKWIFQQLK